MKRILLVDDDRVFNLLSTRTLERMNVAREIHTALNGKEALDLLNDYFQGSKTLPDVILLDLNMPILDGFEFIEAFQRLNLPNKEAVKIIIVTSSQNTQDVNRARKLGVTNYLTKPLTEEMLWSALEN